MPLITSTYGYILSISIFAPLRAIHPAANCFAVPPRRVQSQLRAVGMVDALKHGPLTAGVRRLLRKHARDPTRSVISMRDPK
jgi:hypothetical protein